MKIVLIGDIHLSARNDSLIILGHQIGFFENQLFPYLKKHKIKTLVTCGDLFDRRKYTNHVVLDAWKSRVFNVMKELGITFHVLIGNHDCPWSNTLNANSPSLLLREYDNIIIHQEPKEMMFGKTKVALIPWICKDNYTACMDTMAFTDAQVCFGHFDIQGFEMHRGQTSTEGFVPDAFKKFDMVISGHYHAKSSRGNITYLGTPYGMTWADAGDWRGFYTFDTNTRDLQFIRNPVDIFNKLTWDDKGKGVDYYKSFDLSGIENTYVKLVVANKQDPYQFDKFCDILYSMTLADLKIIEDLSDLEADAVDDDELELEDTMSLVDSYCDAVDTDVDKPKLKVLMKSLYVEALSAEV